jgi:hypothetical protein
MTDDDKLRELSRKGESALNAEAAARAASHDRFERARQAQSRHIAAASTTGLGWLDTGDPALLAPLLIVGVGTFLAGREYPTVFKGSLAAHAALLALLVLARLLLLRGGPREIAWVSSLPFPLEDYLSALGDLEGRTSAPHTSGKSIVLDVTVRFSGEVPGDADAIFAGFDPKLTTHRRKDGILELRRAEFPGGSTNYPLHRYVRKMTAEVLLPLHQRAPLQSVRVGFHH